MDNGGCVYFPARTICEVVGSLAVQIALVLQRVAEVAAVILL
jgi:hypothetical protein